MINIDMASIEKKLAKQMEGKLFANIHVSPGISVDHIYCTKTFFTVLDGKVYELHKNGELYKTDDTLMMVGRECRQVGKYEKGKGYERIGKDYTFEELAKRLEL